MNNLTLLAAVILFGALNANDVKAEPAAQGGEAEFIEKVKQALGETGIMESMNEETAHGSH